MVTWPEVVDRVEHAQPHEFDMRHRRFGGFSRIPLVITGSSGAGKSKMWSRLTGSKWSDAASLATDDGYMIVPNTNRTITLTTIPGQTSRSRYYAMEELFGPLRKLEGVVFVASNGYDWIWPQNADLVASNLSKLDIQSLAERNRREEIANFREVCDRIIQKRLMVSNSSPRWLLVAVNKLDLYWDQRDAARDYYRPYSGSAFDAAATELIRRLGTIDFRYHVLPVATVPSNFRFDSSLGRVDQPSKLHDYQCNESMDCLTETLGELCGI